jgi:putative PIN family toxin of toxin-antitoxin system
MINAVYDTNVYFQAAVARGGPADACWQLVIESLVRAYATDEILTEVQDVLSRPRLRKQFPSLTPKFVQNVIAGYKHYSTMIENASSYFRLARDPGDEKFIDLAIHAKANYVVTRDKDLLDLQNDSAFSTAFPRLNIVTPVGFLEIVRAS